ncbi:carbohydrate kinase family protein [Aureimonas leprariae]|uniref:Carbohydrate kinase n=1 Tax=Plantimonas leprariae TaxID=2615207 RepID=A0A7V7PPQ5_9HYPH|nr:carbohydrate kinase [Aureimonas leprariae]KAB0679999.1 carbohydrate kinase [Aureimonas leprariae]
MFLSCGDSLFDVFADLDADVSRIGLSARIGGSALNAALGLARLGHGSAYFSKISGDLYGRRLRAFMEQEEIDQRFLIPTTRNTTLAMVSLSQAGVPEYSFYIEGTADRSVEPDEVPSPLPDEIEAVHVGGSYSTVSEPTAAAILKLVRQERDRRFVSYDPNIRASVVPDLDVWRAKVAELGPLATLVKASDEDLSQLYPGRSIDAVLADWVAAGAALGIVTRGEKGAVALAASGTGASLPGVSVHVVDTVGAGDTFLAMTLAKLSEDGALSREAVTSFGEADLQALLGAAIRAAAVTCTRRGADLPRRADLGLSALPARK